MKNLISKIKRYIRFSWRDTLITAGVFSAAFVICFVLQRFSENDFHVPLIFVLVVMIISRLTDGYFYGIIATALGVVSVNYVFTYPYFELDFTLTGYPLTFATMLLVSIVTCTMTTRIKNQERRIEEGEKEKIRADLLRGISHDIRTPVTGIAGSADVLLENEDLSENKRRELLIGIKEDTDWLIHMVENVLIVTRVGNSSSGGDFKGVSGTFRNMEITCPECPINMGMCMVCRFAAGVDTVSFPWRVICSVPKSV